MKKRLFLFIALITLTAIALGIGISAVQSPSFSDVASDAWYAQPVLWALGNNITQGTGPSTFSPDNTCTTAQIITFLWRAAGNPEPTIENPFSDVYSGAYYEKAAIWAYENGLTGANTFDGDTPCTRLATVTYLWKLAQSPSIEFSITFDDLAVDNAFAQAVAWAVENGITMGTSATTFSPNTTCTRSQIVTFLHRWSQTDYYYMANKNSDEYQATRNAEKWSSIYATVYPSLIKEMLVIDYAYSEKVADFAIRNARIDWNIYAQIYANVYKIMMQAYEEPYSNDSMVSYLTSEYGFNDNQIDFALTYIDYELDELPRSLLTINESEYYPAKVGSPNDLADRKAVQLLKENPTLTYYGLKELLQKSFTTNQYYYAIFLGSIDWESHVLNQLREQFLYDNLTSPTVNDVQSYFSDWGYFFLNAESIFSTYDHIFGGENTNNPSNDNNYLGKEEMGSYLVWIPTNGGTKYHNSKNCSNMIDPIQVYIETAIANGFTACKRCH